MRSVPLGKFKMRRGACITTRREKKIYDVTIFEKYQPGMSLFLAFSNIPCAP
jgi:hypothetical protein